MMNRSDVDAVWTSFRAHLREGQLLLLTLQLDSDGALFNFSDWQQIA